ncbi:hypothetical protein [Sphingobium nicotianae]|uniref:Uncharacterized protein n=1 Tax=Sphingobium nicotianae TaxID=2782607 RepID=A0A9X1D8L7_9SPHN|nr:hypothetical protein [Sphingobium nicotianae]MBT2185824.1 hypothetical protein [Sphingobium nicotianae]
MYIGELERQTAASVPKLDAVASARLKLTRVSRRRTALLETKVYPFLLERVSPADQANVLALRDSGKAQLTVSVGHIGRWTLREVEESWSDYCAASRAMRTTMIARVGAERELVYPLLTRWPDVTA